MPQTNPQQAMQAPKTRVLIIGAGLGGLVLAILLERAKIEYWILEQNVIISPIGSMIVLSSPVLPLMEQLGLLQAIERKSKPFGTMTFFTGSNKKRKELEVVGKFRFNSAAAAAKSGSGAGGSQQGDGSQVDMQNNSNSHGLGIPNSSMDLEYEYNYNYGLGLDSALGQGQQGSWEDGLYYPSHQQQQQQQQERQRDGDENPENASSSGRSFAESSNAGEGGASNGASGGTNKKSKSKGSDHKERFGYYDQAIPRPDLYTILLSQIPEHRLKIGKRVVNFRQTPTEATVRCSDGTFYQADILVGADGASSSVRQALYRQMREGDGPGDEGGKLPKQDQEDQTYRQVCLVGVTEEMNLRRYPELEDEFSNFKIILTPPYMTWFMPVANNRFCWVVTHTLDQPITLSSQSSSSATAASSSSYPNNNNVNSSYFDWGPDATDEMSKSIRHLPGPNGGTMGEILDVTQRQLISKVLIEDRLFKTWYYGRTVLMGDACHKSVPFTGKGASESMLDAVVLANLIHELTYLSGKGSPSASVPDSPTATATTDASVRPQRMRSKSRSKSSSSLAAKSAGASSPSSGVYPSPKSSPTLCTDYPYFPSLLPSFNSTTTGKLSAGNASGGGKSSSVAPLSHAGYKYNDLQVLFQRYFQIRGSAAKEVVQTSSQFGSTLVQEGWAGKLRRKVVFAFGPGKMGQAQADRLYHQQIQATFMPQVPARGSLALKNKTQYDKIKGSDIKDSIPATTATAAASAGANLVKAKSTSSQSPGQGQQTLKHNRKRSFVRGAMLD